MARYNATERIGINAVEGIVLQDLDWIFREQPIADMGIDAQMELVVNGTPTGELVALQIKTGASHFRETIDAYTYYGDLVHLDYWLSHALPVVLVAHIPESGETLWAPVTAQCAVRTEKAWRIAIPKKNKFGTSTGHLLEKVFEGTPAQQRYRRLLIDLPLMRHIKSGNKVSVELEDWVNKSLGRTSIHVFIDDERDEDHSDDGFTYFGGFGMKELAEKLYPWAAASVDEEFYDANGEFGRRWEDDLARATDIDNGTRQPSDDIGVDVYPYAERGGEIELYRLKLELNELGEAFLVVADHVDGIDSTSA